MGLPDAKEVGEFQKLIAKNPIAFTTAIFFIMFGITYFINIRKNDEAEEYWKELYINERAQKDNLKDQLLINAGVIKKQNEVIIKADSTLKDNVGAKVEKLMKNENN